MKYRLHAKDSECADPNVVCSPAVKKHKAKKDKLKKGKYTELIY